MFVNPFPTIYIHSRRSRGTIQGLLASFENCICIDIFVFDLMNTFRLIRQKDFFKLRMLLDAFNSFKVVSVRYSIPFCMLLVIILIALTALPFSIGSTNSFESCARVLGVICLRQLCIVSSPFRSLAKRQPLHN